MEKVIAAIIDDGVFTDIISNQIPIVIEDDLSVSEGCFDKNINSHATECMSIINKYCDVSNVNWLNICILNEANNNGDLNKFLRALELCEEYNVNVIHLSIGSRQFSDFNEIRKRIDSLASKGTIVIASLSNEGNITYPACLDNVIGVRTSKELSGNKYFKVNAAFDNVNFIASSRHEISLCGYSYETLPTNSFASPLITAKIIDILIKHNSMNFDEIVKILCSEANGSIEDNRLPRYSDVKESEIDIPIICIYMSNNEDAEKIADELSIRFSIDGYYAEVCTINADGFRKFQSDNVASYLKCLSDFCWCDLILIGSADVAVLNSFNSFDIIITDCGLTNDAVIEFEFNSSINEIYNKILEKFK